MALVIRVADPHDAARIVDALHAQADLEDRPAGRPALATRLRRIANNIGDALDGGSDLLPVGPPPDLDD